MPLVELKIPPGVNREHTSLSGKGQWYTCDKVRFRQGYPEKIGGWTAYASSSYVGQCRYLYNWYTLNSSDVMAVGTSQKFYIESGQGLSDITPIRQTFTGLSNIFDTVSGSKIVTVHVTTHGALNGDYVDFSGVSGAVGGIPAADFNANSLPITWIDGNTFTVTLADAASSTLTGTGGTGITAAFEIAIGADVEAYGLGWGAGSWSRGAWGSGATTGVSSSMRMWSGTRFGQDLLFNIVGGGIYYWAAAGAPTTFPRALPLTSISTDPNAPVTALLSTVTSYRHAVVFGVAPIGGGTDPMYLRWSDVENVSGPLSWTADPSNQSGGYRLTEGAYIAAVANTRQETLVWTNSALYSMQYTGAPYFYGFFLLASNLSIQSPNAVAIVNGQAAYWMGNGKFYVYNGAINTLQCDVRKYIFSNINLSQSQQVYAFTVEQYNEVWWLYTSVNSTVNDSYVMFNYADKLWSYGTISRTAWIDTPLRSNPVAAGNGMLFYQEYGSDDLTTGTAVPITAFIETGDMDISSGDSFVFIRRIIPDVSFIGSTAANPVCDMTVSVRRLPGVNYDTSADSAIASSATVPIDLFSSDFWIRLRGREFKLKVSSTTLGSRWQLGTPLLYIQQDGKR